MQSDVLPKEAYPSHFTPQSDTALPLSLLRTSGVPRLFCFVPAPVMLTEQLARLLSYSIFNVLRQFFGRLQSLRRLGKPTHQPFDGALDFVQAHEYDVQTSSNLPEKSFPTLHTPLCRTRALSTCSLATSSSYQQEKMPVTRLSISPVQHRYRTVLLNRMFGKATAHAPVQMVQGYP